MIETHSFQKSDKIANKDCGTDGIIHLSAPGVLEPIAAKDPEEYGPDKNDCVGENRVRLLCSEWSVGRTEERELVGMDGNAAAKGGLLDDLPMTPNDVDTKELAGTPPLDGLALCTV